MKEYILKFTAIFQISVFAISLYYLILSLFGLYKSKNKKEFAPKKKFALIVAAHNEEVVIGNIIESLLKLDYPKKLYDIFVIADNCTDKTAEISKQYNGVHVCERYDTSKKGKGYALEWMFKKIFKMTDKYDAVSIFDADNLVSKNFLKEMNNKMMEGYKVVQGYLDSKNPHDTWITESYSIAFWSSNRVFQLARNNLKLSNQIGGTGFSVDTSILKKLGWGATCLTEDLEFSCKLILNGEKVGWAHDAIIYDEKPLTLKQSWNQRQRWMQGFSDVASRFFFKLIKKSIVDRDIVAFDCALYTIQPYVVLLLGISAILTFVQSSTKTGMNIFIISYLFSDFGWRLFSIFQFLFTPFILVLEKKLSKLLFVLFSLYSLNVFLFSYIFDNNSKLLTLLIANVFYILVFVILSFIFKGKKGLKIFIWYLLYGFYTLTWIPITILGIINKNNKEWNHTKHIRKISINEV